MSIPLLDLKAQYASIKEEIDKAIHEVIESQYFIMGPSVSGFEKAAAEYCETGFAYGCASGSDALLLALMAIDIKPGDYVITSPFTFFATAGAIHRLGAIPIFIDIDPRSYNIDPKKVREFLEGNSKLSNRLNINLGKIKAIIPVHLYGQVADMSAILDIANEFNLFVIEDAAQSIGAERDGVKAGNFGDFGCFSFFPSKNLGAYGDAGLITVRNEEYAEKVDILRLHGARPKYHHKYVGVNSRLDAIQAAILSVKLNYLDTWSEERQRVAESYNSLFEEEGVTNSLQYECSNECMGECSFSDQKLVLPYNEVSKHIYHQYTIRIKERVGLIEALNREGIGNAIYYPIPLHIQECFKELGYNEEDCPVSMCASRQVLSLPIYPELEDQQIKQIVKTVANFLNNA